MDKLNCKIVQDLLPSYIEGLTSEVTNKSLEEHLASCSECEKIRSAMTKEVKELDTAPQKQINFLKKIKRRQWMTAAISVFAALMIFFAVFYFIVQRQFPVSSSEVKISDVYQMKDGSIHYRISANVESYISNATQIGSGSTQILRLYEHRRFSSSSTKSVVSFPENWIPTIHPSTNKEITAIYYEGKNQNDRITIWEKDMNIPKATAEQEAEYERNVRNNVK